MTDPPSQNTPIDKELIDAAVVEQPRPGIIHMMLWTAGTAIALTIDRMAQDLVPEKSSPFDSIQPGISATWAVVIGPAIAAWAILVRRRIRGIRFPTEAGEWLLLVSGADFVFSQFCAITGRLTEDTEAMQSEWLLLWFGVAHLFPAIAYVIAALYNRQPRSWMVCFSLIATVRFLMCLPLFAISFGVLWPYLTFGSFSFLCLPLVVLVTIAVDIRRRRRYGWLHWVGVVTYLCRTSTLIGLMFWLLLTAK